MNNLPSPNKLQMLQNALHAKAKAQPAFRFYSLWDKIHRRDTLAMAWKRVKANRGTCGVDGETIKAVETKGVEKWLEEISEELKGQTYTCKPLRRIWIPKSNGDKRPLSIPTLRDRVVQMAVNLILSPIFEADFHKRQYGFRKGIDAKIAVRRIYWNVSRNGYQEVVDADLKNFFGTIPHAPLLKCLERRIADGNILSLIKRWLKAPVVERKRRHEIRTTEAKDTGRGAPQGGVISPLLGNLYFRRFLLGWEKFGLFERLKTDIVSYADDFVICCKRGNAGEAYDAMMKVMKVIGLEVNEEKTSIRTLPEESFDFLGYTFGRMYTHKGRSYIGTKPSKKSIKRVTSEIHEITSLRFSQTPIEDRVMRLNWVLRGWSNYFNQGPVIPVYQKIEKYTVRRLQIWNARKHKIKGRGFKQLPESKIYGELRLFKLPSKRADMPNAKA